MCGDREGTQALIFTSLSSGMDKRLFSIISNHNYTWQDYSVWLSTYGSPHILKHHRHPLTSHTHAYTHTHTHTHSHTLAGHGSLHHWLPYTYNSLKCTLEVIIKTITIPVSLCSTSIQTNMYTCTHMHMHIHTYTYTNTHTHIHTHTNPINQVLQHSQTNTCIIIITTQSCQLIGNNTVFPV